MRYKVLFYVLIIYISAIFFKIILPYLLYYTYQYEIQQLSDALIYQENGLITNKWYSIINDKMIGIKVQQVKTYLQIQELVMLKQQYNKIGYNVICILIVMSMLLTYTQLQTKIILYKHEVENSKLIIRSALLIVCIALLSYLMLSSTIELHKLMMYSDLLIYAQKEEIKKTDPLYLILIPLMITTCLFFIMKNKQNAHNIQCIILATILLWFYNQLGYYLTTSIILIYVIFIIEISITVWIWLCNNLIKRTNC